MDVKIREATEQDAASITEIYNQAIGLRSATAHIEPVSVESRQKWLHDRDWTKHPVFVAETESIQVAGWLSLSAYRPGRMALEHTAEISFYVHEECRGRRIGSQLVRHSVETGPSLGLRNLFAVVLDINGASIGLLEGHGFSQWGHLPNVAEIDGVECGHYYFGLRILT